MVNSQAYRSGFAGGLILGALALGLSAGCLTAGPSTVPPPRSQSSPEAFSSPMLCDDVIAMPCLSGRTCMVEEGKSCQVCKCLGPNIAPLDHPWMATEDPLLQGGPIGGPEPH